MTMQRIPHDIDSPLPPGHPCGRCAAAATTCEGAGIGYVYPLCAPCAYRSWRADARAMSEAPQG